MMTEAQMFESLRSMYPANEYALLPQVRNGTGHTKVTRTADAIGISLWPSRGIDMIGFEFKDSRADVLKELKSVEKADEIGKHCRFWWMVVSDAKWISKDELPSGWGLIVIKDGVAKKVVQAPSRDRVPPDLPLIAAILKSAQSVVTDEADIQRRISEAVRKEVDGLRKYYEEQKSKDNSTAAGKLEKIQKRLSEFRDDTGIDLVYADWNWAPFAKAAKFVMDGGVENLGRIVSWCDQTSREAKQLLGEDSVVQS